MEFSALLPLAAALAPLAAVLIPASLIAKNARLGGHLVFSLMICSLSLAAASAAYLAWRGGPVTGTFASAGPVALTVYFDTVSAVLLLLVTFLGAAVSAFSRNYLGGDAGQGIFFRWLSITVGCVLVLIVSGNLALFALAWVGTSLSLHRLLVFYPDRPGARMAALNKSVVSRFGDVCVFAAIVLAWREFGTLDYSRIFAAASAGPTSGISAIAFLLVAGAVLKSAQFPFHSWLPDTMETPTPVSALMHAGIINAGGFLIIRFSPLVVLSPASLDLLAVVGAVTALFGSLVMTTQTSIKRSLAFSTVAQMGFMMLQCGLGAFALALLHIVAHSLYKAHAFLSSGGVIARMRAGGEMPDKAYPGLPAIAAAFGLALGLTFAAGLVLGQKHWSDPAGFALTAILTIAMAQLLWGWLSFAGPVRGVLAGLTAGFAVCLVSFALHAGVKSLLGPSVAEAPVSSILWPLALAAPAAFLLVGARVFFPPSWATTRLGRALFVHAYNGFYLSTITQRILMRIQGARVP